MDILVVKQGKLIVDGGFGCEEINKDDNFFLWSLF